MNAVVFAAGMSEGGREQAREKLEAFWLSIASEGSLSPFQRRWIDKALAPFGGFWPGSRWFDAWLQAVSGFLSPYEFNPLNINPVRALLEEVVDFERLRASEGVKLFIAATNVRTGRGEIFHRNILTADHVMASACLPELYQAVVINGEPYWDGGYAGNPPLWPLFYETHCRDTIIVQINPVERDETPRTPEEIRNRVDEVTFNASLLAELRAANFVARLIELGVLDSADYRDERLHRIGGAGRLESFNASTKNDVSWPFLKLLRDLGRSDTKAWLEANFDKIGVVKHARHGRGAAARASETADEGRGGDAVAVWTARRGLELRSGEARGPGPSAQVRNSGSDNPFRRLGAFFLSLRHCAA